MVQQRGLCGVREGIKGAVLVWCARPSEAGVRRVDLRLGARTLQMFGPM